jgi:phage gp46-like protein
MAQQWDRDPATGDYILASDGTPQQTDSLEVPAYHRLKTHRTQWMYAPDPDYGSDFYQVQKRNSAVNGGLLENIADKALQPMIDDGRAASVVTTNTTAPGDDRSSSSLDIAIVDRQSQQTNFTFTPLGT